MPSKLPPPRRQSAKDLREQLHRLDAVAQALQAERITLEHQLRSVHERTSFNDTQIRRIMNDLDQRLFKENRSQSQPEFQRSVAADDFVIEGICSQMEQSPQLMSAVEAVSKNQGTIADNNLLLMAIMTELSGDPFQLAHRVAVRLMESDRTKDQQRQKFPGQPNVSSALPAIVNPALPPTESAVVGDAGTEAVRDPSVIPLLSPSIKSETGSTANPYNVANTLPALTASTTHDTPAVVAASVESTPVPLAEQGKVVAHGMAALQKNFPGLLESLTRPSMTRAKPTSAAAVAGTPTGARGKRVRASIENEVSPSPGAVKPGKKVKTDKEPAIAHTFVMFMKHLEQIHQSGQAITENLKCSRCQVIKRDVRVLNCLHLYCHRCILQLRNEAQKGDAVRGFQSFCVKPGCEQVVSGKTTVIDSEIIEFLQWYDTQSPAITSLAAQLNVLNSAIAKYPEDHDIKRKLEQVQTQFRALQLSATADAPCDLMQIAKLARKPY